MVTDTGASQLTWSAIGLDQARPLVMGEFKDAALRAVRFPLDPTSHQLVVGGDGVVHATEALSVPYLHVQGVVSHNGRWWFASSSDKALYYRVPGSAATSRAWVSWCVGDCPTGKTRPTRTYCGHCARTPMIATCSACNGNTTIDPDRWCHLIRIAP